MKQQLFINDFEELPFQLKAIYETCLSVRVEDWQKNTEGGEYEIRN